MGNENKAGRRKRLIVVCIIAAVVLLLAIAYFFYYRDLISAVTMRIQRLVGTVNLYNEEGNEQSLREKMRLGAGQTITTAGESLIMVSLDDAKLMTMEESSRANIRARGKHLEFDLLEGNLYFNLTEKLGDNESFNINTSTMVCGIRGTSAYIGKDAAGHEVLMVTDGIVHVIATNPVTKETIEEDVPAGQMRTVYLDEEAEGSATISFGRQKFKEEDLPAMALDTMRKYPELLNRVSKATGFSTKKIITLAELSCTRGVSMYGSAAGELAAEGIEDAIPYLGQSAKDMVSSANSAVGIAREDLPLEVAIIKGYRDVMNEVSENGYDSDEAELIMDGTRECVEEIFDPIDSAQLTGVDRLPAGMSVMDSVWVAGMRMAEAKEKLSSGEFVQVTGAISTLYKWAVDDAVATSTPATKSSAVLGAVNRVSNHVTSVVTAEMGRSSNGDQTVAALLAGGGPKKDAGRSVAQKETKDIVEEAKASAKVPDLGDDRNKNTGSATASGGAAAVAAASDEALIQAILAQQALLAAEPTPTPVPEWLWKQWQKEAEERARNGGGESEPEEETSAPAQPAPAPAATTGTIDGNGQITIPGAASPGSVNTSGTSPRFVSPANAMFNLPLSVQDSNGTEVYRFNDLKDIDWDNSGLGSYITDTDNGNLRIHKLSGAPGPGNTAIYDVYIPATNQTLTFTQNNVNYEVPRLYP